jgi:4'-phosphopantetheinyl transferase
MTAASRHRLDPSAVDVVSCSLHVDDVEVDALRACLSEDERARAGRFFSARGRDQFVVARGRLRQVLGALSGRSPRALAFAVAAGGKPRLEDGGRLRFNVAHSGDLMLCAVSLDHEVGVDVERVREDIGHEDIARRFFAEDEVRSLAAVPPASRREAFFACWTRKEAVVKATGEGLARSLDGFAVSVDPARAELRRADPALGRIDEWSLLVVPVPAGYHATVAVRAPVSLRVWTWPVPWVAATPPAG